MLIGYSDNLFTTLNLFLTFNIIHNIIFERNHWFQSININFVIKAHVSINIKRIMKSSLLYLLLLLCITTNAQNTFTGIVLTEKDHTPVEFALVYINGSTKAVHTDSNGSFTISGIPIPCKLIVSHMAYNLNQIAIDKLSPEMTTIYLTEKQNQLSAVFVSGYQQTKNALFKNLEMVS